MIIIIIIIVYLFLFVYESTHTAKKFGEKTNSIWINRVNSGEKINKINTRAL